MSNRRSRTLAALAWAGLTAAALLTPGPSLPDVGDWLPLPEWLRPWVDKVVHLALFLVLALLVHRRFEGTSSCHRAIWTTLATTLSYVFVLELAQVWIPGRSWETLDLVAGVTGVVLALLLRLRPGAGQES